MSVQSEITRIEQNVANTYTVLGALGADIPSDQNSDNLSATAGSVKAVLYSEQSLTDEQKAQARENIGAAAEGEAGGSGIVISETPPDALPNGEHPLWMKPSGGETTGLVTEANLSAYSESVVDGVLYTDLDYITGDGKAYIVTDYIPNSNTRVEARLYFNVTTTTRCVFGARKSTSVSRFDFGNNSSSKYNFGWNNAATAATIAEINESFDLEINRNVVYINDEEVISREDAEWTAPDCEFAFFGCNTNGSVTPLAPTGTRIHWFKIYEGEELLHHFVPRRHIAYGVGLYDKIHKKFFTNKASSGSFTGD